MFFTVKKNIKVAGKYYRPCVCYELPQYLLPTIRDLEEKGTAIITEEPVFFQNGTQIDSEELKKKLKEAKKLEQAQKKEAKKAKKSSSQETEETTNESSSAEDTDEAEGF